MYLNTEESQRDSPLANIIASRKTKLVGEGGLELGDSTLLALPSIRLHKVTPALPLIILEDVGSDLSPVVIVWRVPFESERVTTPGRGPWACRRVGFGGEGRETCGD
jgi:hypothetical protein